MGRVKKWAEWKNGPSEKISCRYSGSCCSLAGGGGQYEPLCSARGPAGTAGGKTAKKNRWKQKKIDEKEKQMKNCGAADKEPLKSKFCSGSRCERPQDVGPSNFGDFVHCFLSPSSSWNINLSLTIRLTMITMMFSGKHRAGPGEPSSSDMGIPAGVHSLRQRNHWSPPQQQHWHHHQHNHPHQHDQSVIIQIQALLAGDLVSQGSWLRYWLVTFSF